MANVFAVGAALSKIKLLTDKNIIKFILITILLIITAFMVVCFLIIAVFTSLFFSPEASGKVYISDILFSEGLGILSEKYESNGNPSTIANNPGDIGGKSYGAWQIASGVGTMDSFLDWLKIYDNSLCKRLIEAKKKDNDTYGSNFDKEWIKIANEKRDYFYQVQWCFIKVTHYDPVINYFKKQGIDFEKRTWTLRNVIWSTAVQHGPGDINSGAILIIGKQNLKFSKDLADDAQAIKGIYTERRKVNIYFPSSSQAIKSAVYNRFIQEEADALEMLNQELNKLKGEGNG